MRTLERSFKLITLYWLLLSATEVFAFESFPEFTTITEFDQATDEIPAKLSTDYSAIVLSYEKWGSWEHAWLTHDSSFDGSVGSLDGSHFLMNDRAKLRRFLTDTLEFRFTYFAEQNFERNSLFHILEFIYWPHSSIGISLYGEPFFLKRQNNIGAALIFKPESRHEIRIFNTFVNAVRNERNDQTDNFIAPNFPYAFGITGRTWSPVNASSKNFLEYSLRYETFTKWLFPSGLYEYDYWRKVASAFIQKYWSVFSYFSIRLQFDQKLQSTIPTDPASSIVPQSSHKDRFQSYIRETFLNMGPWDKWKLTPGMAFNSRAWQMSNGSVTHLDFIPHIIWQLPALTRTSSQDLWTFEYDFIFHRETGSDALKTLSTAENTYESRLDLSYDFAFSETNSLRLQGTFNLNYLLAGRPWGGGNAQLHVDF